MGFRQEVNVFTNKSIYLLVNTLIQFNPMPLYEKKIEKGGSLCFKKKKCRPTKPIQQVTI